MKYNSGYAGIGLIPHLEFWSEYPGLVMDGIAYSKILISTALGQSGHSTVYSASSKGGFNEIGSEIDNLGGGTFSSSKPLSQAPPAQFGSQPHFSTEGQG